MWRKTDTLFSVSVLSSPCPHAPISPSKSCKPHPSFALIHRPLRHRPLTLDALNHLLQLCLHHHTSYNHLCKRRMQRLEIEDQVQLADILEKAIEGLYEDLDEI